MERGAAEFDGELATLRSPSVGAINELILDARYENI
jgi:hypothetical protein